MSSVKIEYSIINKNKILFKSDFDGFIIKYENENYIISVNHFLPIDEENVKIKIQEISFSTNVLYNPLWNEIVILKCPSSIKLSSKTIKNFKFSVKKNENFYIGNSSVLKYIDNTYRPLADCPLINTNPTLNYVCVETKGKLENGQSGSCVYDKNGKIVGIFISNCGDYFFILPIIYLQKTLIKNNKIDIFSLESNKEITRINNYNIKNHFIFSRQLNIWIPVATYNVLEGDDNKFEIVEFTQEKKKTRLNYTIVNELLRVKNTNKIEYIGNKYIINISLLRYLKLTMQKELLKKIYQLLNKSEVIFLEGSIYDLEIVQSK